MDAYVLLFEASLFPKRRFWKQGKAQPLVVRLLSGGSGVTLVPSRFRPVWQAYSREIHPALPDRTKRNTNLHHEKIYIGREKVCFDSHVESGFVGVRSRPGPGRRGLFKRNGNCVSPSFTGMVS